MNSTLRLLAIVAGLVVLAFVLYATFGKNRSVRNHGKYTPTIDIEYNDSEDASAQEEPEQAPQTDVQPADISGHDTKEGFETGSNDMQVLSASQLLPENRPNVPGDMFLDLPKASVNKIKINDLRVWPQNPTGTPCIWNQSSIQAEDGQRRPLQIGGCN